MKIYRRLLGAVVIAAFWLGTAAMCGGVECYTCTDCSGQYGNMINDNVICSDGFDSKSDWEDFKEIYETDDAYKCTCTYD